MVLGMDMGKCIQEEACQEKEKQTQAKGYLEKFLPLPHLHKSVERQWIAEYMCPHLLGQI